MMSTKSTAAGSSLRLCQGEILALAGHETSRLMQIIVNGETMEIADEASVRDLIERLNLTEKRTALEINRSVLPRSEYETTSLKDGDRVEIVHAIGGG